MTSSPLASRAPRTPVEVRLWNSRTSVAAKRIALPLRVASRTSSSSVSSDTPISRSSEPSSNRIAILPLVGMLAKASIELRRTAALGGREHDVERRPTRSRPRAAAARSRSSRPRASGSRLTIGRPRVCGAALGQAPDLQAIDLAVGREEQHRRVGRGDEQLGDRILVLGRHAGAALAAAVLGAERVERGALDVAAQGHGHDHVLALDQILVVDAVGRRRDLGDARRRIWRRDLVEFVAHHRVELDAVAEDLEQFADRGRPAP